MRTLPRAVRRMFFFPGNRREPAPRVGAPWRPSSRLRPVCAASPRRADEGCLPHPAAAHAAPALPGTSAHPTRQVQTAVRMPSAPWRPGRRPRSRPSRWRLRRRPRRRAGSQLAFIRGTRLERPLATASTASLPARLRRTTSTTTERRWPSGAGRPPRGGSRATVRRMHARCGISGSGGAFVGHRVAWVQTASTGSREQPDWQKDAAAPKRWRCAGALVSPQAWIWARGGARCRGSGQKSQEQQQLATAAPLANTCSRNQRQDGVYPCAGLVG